MNRVSVNFISKTGSRFIGEDNRSGIQIANGRGRLRARMVCPGKCIGFPGLADTGVQRPERLPRVGLGHGRPLLVGGRRTRWRLAVVRSAWWQRRLWRCVLD